MKKYYALFRGAKRIDNIVYTSPTFAKEMQLKANRQFREYNKLTSNMNVPGFHPIKMVKFKEVPRKELHFLR